MNNLNSKIKEMRPQFLDARDSPWIRSIVEEYRRFEGKPLREWHQRLREPLPYYSPKFKLKFVIKAIDDAFKAKERFPRKKLLSLRKLLFKVSETNPWPCSIGDIECDIRSRRGQILLSQANHLPQELLSNGESFESILFADLPSERIVGKIPCDFQLSDLLLSANTYLLKSIIQRSVRVDLLIRGNVRPIVRQALLRGLVCVVKPLLKDSQYDANISLSGPLGLFRHARLYGRLLVEILPFLPNCDQFSLIAILPEGESQSSWIIQSGDPIKPAEHSAFDSQLERRFARDFSKITNDYDLIREPQAIEAGQHLIFPDFAIKHRTDLRKTWLLEIVGYWTPTYLQKKIENLRLANIQNLIICVSKRLGTTDQWPAHARVLLFDRWVDSRAVLSAMT